MQGDLSFMKNKRLDALRNAFAIVLAGVLIGVVGGLFLNTLQMADDGRLAFIDMVARHSIPGWLAAGLAGSVGAALAAWLAHRWAKDAPQLSIARRAAATESATSNLSALTANFAGTSLAAGAGLAIGPERPAIQMGGAIGHFVSRWLRMRREDRELLTAAAGGAGVATMFNSPLGCAAYTVESVLSRVDRRITMTTLGVGVVAVAVARLVVGRDVNFIVGQLPDVHFEHLFLYLGLGCLIAVLANLHVHVIMLLTRLFVRLSLPAAVRGAIIGGAIGLLAWFSPGLVGVGDSMTQGVLDGRFALSAMAVLFLVRFFLGPLSLTAGTPGGYFTPVLLLGALSGAMYASMINVWFSSPDLSPTAFALVGMAVALATLARAPFTGILLVMETTGVFSLALPMTIAVVGAAVVIRMMHTPSLSHGLEIAMVEAAKRKGPRSRGNKAGAT